MATCAACDTVIFLGKKVGPYQYCNGACADRGPIQAVVRTIPVEDAEIEAHILFASPCPRCRQPGPVDVHTSHFVWSAIFVTSWSSTPHLCCKECGVTAQAIAALQSLLLGWWGIPMGLIVTPVFILGNFAGMLAKIGAKGPSADLRKRARLMLAQRRIEQARYAPRFERAQR